MMEEEIIATYFQRINEVVNTIKGIGEDIEEKLIVQNLIRTLPIRFDPKVCAIE